MDRTHFYPLIAALGSFNLLAVVILLIPQAVKTHRYNRCVDVQITMRNAINPQGLKCPGHFPYLKAIDHCEGR